MQYIDWTLLTLKFPIYLYNTNFCCIITDIITNINYFMTKKTTNYQSIFISNCVCFLPCLVSNTIFTQYCVYDLEIFHTCFEIQQFTEVPLHVRTYLRGNLHVKVHLGSCTQLNTWMSVASVIICCTAFPNDVTYGLNTK